MAIETAVGKFWKNRPRQLKSWQVLLITRTIVPMRALAFGALLWDPLPDLQDSSKPSQDFYQTVPDTGRPDCKDLADHNPTRPHLTDQT